MAMHIGAPATLAVKVGDRVKVGTLIGESGAGLSSPVYSSVSGTVKKIDEIVMIAGNHVPTVVIESDGNQTPDESVAPLLINSKSEFLEALQKSGIVGLGGAGFPTSVKLNADAERVDTLIIHGAECEPYITSDTRTMIDRADDVAEGEEMSIQFYEGESNPAQFTPEVNWNEPDANILGDVAAVCEMLAAKGLGSSDLIVSPDVGTAILSNEAILKLLDNRNINIGGVDPAQLPNGVTKIARLNCNGHVVDVLQYSETYTNDAGANVPYITKGKAIVTAPGCGRTLYGAVTQVEQSDGQFHTYTAKRVPKYYSDAKGNTRELYLTSCPLCIPNNKNAWYVINAINA